MRHFFDHSLRAAFLVVYFATAGCGGGGKGPDDTRPDTFVPLETCNGIDDDFDMVVDDGAPCAPTSGAEQTACVAGACTIVTCAADTADCDDSYTNGCEIATRLDRLHCGGCTACATGSQCVEGTCVAVTTHVAGGTGDQAALRIVDRGAGLFAIAGEFKSHMNIGGNYYGSTIKDTGFVWSFSSTFAHQWMTTFAAPISTTWGQTVNVSDLEVAADGALYCTGSFHSSLTNGTQTVTESASSGASYLGRLASTGDPEWLIVPDMPGGSSLSFSYPVDLVIGISDVRLAGQYQEYGSAIAGFFNRYGDNAAQLSQNYTGTNIRTSGAVAYGNGTLVLGSFDGSLMHGVTTSTSDDDAVYAVEFTDVGADGAVVLVRDTPDMGDGPGMVIKLGSNGYAFTHYVGTQGTLRAFNGGAETWAVPLAGVESPLLMTGGGKIYLVTRTRASEAASIGATTFPATTMPTLLIAILNTATGAVEHAGRINVGGLSYIADGVVASDGRIWLAGAANGNVYGTTTTGTDVLIMSVNGAQIP